MKRIITFIAAVVMLAVSCQKENNINNENTGITAGKLTATFVQTKVSYTEVGSDLQPAWEIGDEIIGFDDAGNTYTFTVTEVKSATATLSIDGEIADGTYHLIYKSGESATSIKSKTLTVKYNNQPGDKTMPAVMFADGTVRGGSCDFAFRNAGAIIGISAVNGLASGTAINKITVQGLNLPTAIVSLDGSSLALTTSTKIGNISTAALSGITVTDANGTLSSPVFVAVPAGAEISSIVVNEGYIYNLASPKTVEAGQYLFVRGQTFQPSVKYVVHYRLIQPKYDAQGSYLGVDYSKPVAADKTGYSVLGTLVKEEAKPMEELKKQYSIKKNGEYLYYIVTQYQEECISHDGYEIIILYEKKPSVG